MGTPQLGPEYGAEVRQSDVLMGEPIVGVENVTLTEHGEGAREARPLPTPKTPTLAARDKHYLTHLPYADWCPFCVACRRPNSPHKSSHEKSRELPLLTADYGFLRNPGDQDCITLLVIKVMPFKLVFATVVNIKGPDPDIVKRVSRFINEAGLVRFTYRADREPALQALLDEAIKMSGKHGAPDESSPTAPLASDDKDVMIQIDEDKGLQPPVDAPPVEVAAPEHTQPGESQSNGIIERTIQQVVDLFRTINTSLEARIKARIPLGHPVVQWLVEHCAFLLTKYQLGTDGKTAYGRLHGKEVRERICEFGEKVLYFVPKRLRTKSQPRWRYGIFLGRAWNADQNFLGVAGGSIVTSRAMVRLVPQVRWDLDRIQQVTGTPFEQDLEFDGWMESSENPHEHIHDDGPDEPTVTEEDALAIRRLKITKKDIEIHGYSKGCPKCNFYKDDNMARAKSAKHTEVSRTGIYQALEVVKTEQFQRVGQDPAKLEARDRAERQERPKPGKAESSMELEPEMPGSHDLMDEPMEA